MLLETIICFGYILGSVMGTKRCKEIWARPESDVDYSFSKPGGRKDRGRGAEGAASPGKCVSRGREISNRKSETEREGLKRVETVVLP